MSLISPYLNQRVTVVPRTGHDGDGAAVYGAGAEVKARVEQRKRLVRSEGGDQVLSDMQVFLEPDQAISEEDRITYDGDTYEVLSVTAEQGLDAISHLVAWTGRVKG